MPIRPARFSDIPVMARVLAASFGPDELFQVLFPHQDLYPEDLVTALRRSLRVSWWDYSKVLMVSYEEKPSGKAIKENDEEQHITVCRGEQDEIITGLCEWQRIGVGWESVWNLWGRWDPSKLTSKRSRFENQTANKSSGRLFMRYHQWRNKLAYFFRPCRASARPTAADPDPLLLGNFFVRTLPYCHHLYSNPLTPWRTNHWCLEVLGIHPHYQSKGYGKRLVEYGIAKAQCDTASGRTGIPCVVTASVPGEPFYQRVGFKELVGYQTRSVEGVEGVNPLEAKGCKGGAVLWTWVKEDHDAAKKKMADVVMTEKS